MAYFSCDRNLTHISHRFLDFHLLDRFIFPFGEIIVRHNVYGDEVCRPRETKKKAFFLQLSAFINAKDKPPLWLMGNKRIYRSRFGIDLAF